MVNAFLFFVYSHLLEYFHFLFRNFNRLPFLKRDRTISWDKYMKKILKIKFIYMGSVIYSSFFIHILFYSSYFGSTEPFSFTIPKWVFFLYLFIVSIFILQLFLRFKEYHRVIKALIG